MKKTVSDIITNEIIENWEKGSIINIKAGTGVGKSYFIKNKLYTHAKKNGKKILFLIHRTNCINQFQAEIEREFKTDVITIKSYQYLEALYKYGRSFEFDEYEYIVSDEFHYFISDSLFNNFTDISLNMILNQSNKTKIFMSATGDSVKAYFNHKKIETIDYELPINFDFIDTLSFFNKDETLEKFMEDAIENNIKSIFFIQSATEAYRLYKKYKKFVTFNCGKSDKHYKYVNEDEINSVLENERFEKLIMISTTAMDAGVNLIDTSLHHVVCNVKDTTTLIQCIGRKRIQEGESGIHLFIKTIMNQQLGGMETQLKIRMENAKYLKDYGTKKYIDKYQRETDHSGMIYDDIDSNGGVVKKINELMYFKCLTDLRDINIMKTYGDFGYCKFLADKFGFYDGFKFDYSIMEEDDMKSELEEYLDGVVGEKLLKNEQDKLINNVSLKDGRGRVQKSINLLNAYFTENEMGYMIVSKQSSKIIDGKKKNFRYWEVLNNIVQI